MNNNGQSQIPFGMLMNVMHAKQHLIANYEQLLNMASDQEDIGLIRNIRLDEIGHLNAFINLYVSLFHEQPDLADTKVPQNGSFLSAVKNSIMEELNLYIIFSNIIFTDSNPDVRNVFFRVLTDDNRHASRFNYIYTKTIESKLH